MANWPRLTARLDRLDLADRLRVIPGVRVDRRGQLTVPWHAVELVDRVLREEGAGARGVAWDVPPPQPLDWSTIEARLGARGELRSWVLDGYLTAYQREGLVFACSRRGALLHHPAGSGKTCSGIAWALYDDGPVLVVTRAAARPQWADQIQHYTHLRPFTIRPRGYVRKGVVPETLEAYLARCEREGQRPVVVVAWTSLSDWITELLSVRFSALVADESHSAKATSRWQAIPLPEPETLLDRAKQEADARARGGFVSARDGDERVMMVPRDNISASAGKLARAVERCLCTSATPVKDRLRDLWSQLDVMEPGAHGNATVWLNRYASRKPGLYGGYDTTGASNLDELSYRLSFLVHHVDSAVARVQLPAARRQTYRIAPEDQCAPGGGFVEELKRARLRGAAAVLEVKVAEAASRKRPAVIALVKDHVANGHKVTVFTGRRKDAERLGAELRRALKDAGPGQSPITVWASHGGEAPEARAQHVKAYYQHPGPCVFVGTGDAFGEAITGLHDTDAVLFAMLPITPASIIQQEGRFLRLGSKRPVLYYYLVCEDTVDEHIASILLDKLDTVIAVAPDSQLPGIADAVGGTADEEALFASILAKIEGGDDDV